MIPVGDSPQSRTIPWITWSLILANIFVFVWMLTLDNTVPASNATATADFAEQTSGVCYGFRTLPTELDRAFCQFGFQPDEFFDTVAGDTGTTEVDTVMVLLTVVASAFVHGGWLHIIGNMLFLWVFGDNVEDRFGHLRFLVFYLASAVAATLAQGFMDPSSAIPVVGASGAVAGVLGAYLLFYPRATVRVVIPFFILIFIPIPIPAVIMIGIWFAQNLFAGVASLGPETSAESGVAFFAHIGGFLFGVLIAFLRNLVPRHAPRFP
ncbi:MAG: rhomboid family intramembrane serine protease [Tepidiformaceae bacterium]